MTKEINMVKVSEPIVNVETLIQRAIDKGVPVDTMERIVAMRKDLKAEWAKEQYDLAMMAFQNECPVLKKTKTVNTNSGGRAYSYAPLESIVGQTKGLILKHGFSYQIQTDTIGKEVMAICIARHQCGHSEQSSVKVPLGNKTAVMSDTQVVAAALTFAKRYAFCNVFGILTGDEDIDAASTSDSSGSTKEDPRIMFNKAAVRMRACKSVDSLAVVWKSLTAKERADDELLALKNELKEKMS